jgi:uncharacterized Zn finger protein
VSRRWRRRGWGGFRPYVPILERRAQTAERLLRLRADGGQPAPIRVAGRKITTTYWGDAWCRNLEGYSDFANRLPRGRTYLRNGSVIDLHIEAGRVRALVSGWDVYEVVIGIEPLERKRWDAIKAACAGKLGSLVELLRGSLSKGVMEVVTRRDEGLFPAPREIALDCSCPDWASMCKHVAAALYGVGARLDQQPELLFALRGVDPAELVEVAAAQPVAAGQRKGRRVLATDQLAAVFGVDVETQPRLTPPAAPRRRRPAAARPGPAAVTAPRERGTAAGGRSAGKRAGVAPPPMGSPPPHRGRSVAVDTESGPRAKRVSPKKVSPRKVSPRKVSPKKVSRKKVSPKKPVPRKPTRRG